MMPLPDDLPDYLADRAYWVGTRAPVATYCYVVYWSG